MRWACSHWKCSECTQESTCNKCPVATLAVRETLAVVVVVIVAAAVVVVVAAATVVAVAVAAVVVVSVEVVVVADVPVISEKGNFLEHSLLAIPIIKLGSGCGAFGSVTQALLPILGGVTLEPTGNVPKHRRRCSPCPPWPPPSRHTSPSFQACGCVVCPWVPPLMGR